MSWSVSVWRRGAAALQGEGVEGQDGETMAISEGILEPTARDHELGSVRYICQLQVVLLLLWLPPFMARGFCSVMHKDRVRKGRELELQRFCYSDQSIRDNAYYLQNCECLGWRSKIRWSHVSS
jgi:hypothetical protein